MRRAMLVMISLVLLLSWGKTAAGAILPDLTNWGGASLLSLIQDRVNGKVSAREKIAEMEEFVRTLGKLISPEPGITPCIR